MASRQTSRQSSRRTSRQRRRLANRIGVWAGLLLGGGFAAFPVLWMLVSSFNLIDPCSGGRHFVEVKKVCVKQFVQIHVPEITGHYFSFRLKCMYYFLDSAKFFMSDFGGFVDKNNITELNLLYYEIFQILLIEIF